MICACGKTLQQDDGAFCMYCMMKTENGYDSLNDRQKIRWLGERLDLARGSARALRAEIHELQMERAKTESNFEEYVGCAVGREKRLKEEIRLWIADDTASHPRFLEWSAWYNSLGAARKFDEQLSFREWVVAEMDTIEGK